MHPRLLIAFTGRSEYDHWRDWLARHGYLVTERFDEPFDLGLSLAGTHIFTPDEIERARCGIVNLHLAPLPEFRGRYSATHAILAGCVYGVTLHYVDERIDTGPIVAERRFAIDAFDTARTLRVVARLEAESLLADVLPKILSAAVLGCRYPSYPQDEARAHYYDRHSLPAPDGSPLLARALDA